LGSYAGGGVAALNIEPWDPGFWGGWAGGADNLGRGG
jgi:hypothetical protein